MRTFVFPAIIATVIPTTVAQAHPHIFVSTEVTVIFEDGVPAAVDLAWIYDDYFSLLITADLGLDLDDPERRLVGLDPEVRLVQRDLDDLLLADPVGADAEGPRGAVQRELAGDPEAVGHRLDRR